MTMLPVDDNIMFMDKAVFFRVQNLLKAYNGQTVLDIPNLQLEAGQLVAVMGKNGSGKSTLLRLLSQQENFEGGLITFCGESLASVDVQINPRMAYLSEEHELIFNKPLLFWASVFKKIHSKFDDRVFDALVGRFGLDPHKRFQNLSRGQKMKSLFCLIAAKRPDLYILDEITAVLDSGSRWTLMEFLRAEADRGAHVIISTNIANEMEGFATNAIFLDKGKIIYQSECAQFCEHFFKFRIPVGEESFFSREIQVRKVTLNADGTWTFIARGKANEFFKNKNILEDKRAISIAEVQTFFTSMD